MQILDAHADINHRYRKLIHESLRDLDKQHVRLTLARGIAKRLIVLSRAAGAAVREQLTAGEAETLDTALAKADRLVYQANDPR